MRQDNKPKICLGKSGSVKAMDCATILILAKIQGARASRYPNRRRGFTQRRNVKSRECLYKTLFTDVTQGVPKLALARIGVGAPKLALARHPSRLRLDVKASFDAPAIGPCVTSFIHAASVMREYTSIDFLAHIGKLGEAGQIGSRGSGFALCHHEPISFYVASLRRCAVA